MVLMKFLKSISITIKLILSFCLVIGIIFLSGCAKKKYPNPTNDFYVNDYANAFHPVTSNAIIIEGERLYDDTKKIDKIGGAQIVFASFIVDNIEEIAAYNRTEIFRQWKIGKNDMGILVLMFFTIGVEEDVTYLYLEETQIEAGYRMESYLSAGRMGRLLDETIYGDTYQDLDMKIAYLFYELLTIVYEEVYSDYYDSFTYDMEYFRETMNNYVDDNDQDNWNLIALLLLLFGGANRWYIIIPAALFIVGGTLRIRNRGGGGSSGGYGIFRRR